MKIIAAACFVLLLISTACAPPTPIKPPATATRIPTETPTRRATARPTPTLGAGFNYDDRVSADDKKIIEDAFALAKKHYGDVGAIVGATHPAELIRLREQRCRWTRPGI